MNIISSTSARNYIPLCVNDVEKMRLDVNGFLGIGTTVPSKHLDVSGGKINVTNDYTGAVDTTKACITINSTTNNAPAMYLMSSGLGWGSGILFANTYVGTGRTMSIHSSGNDGVFYFFDLSGNSARLTISNTGMVGIGMNGTSSWPLQIATSVATGSITANSVIKFGVAAIYTSGANITNNWSFSMVTSASTRCGGDMVFYSDARIKTNVKDVSDNAALITFRQIQPKTYEYIDKISRNPETVFGFIAQEVRQVLPASVSIQREFIPNIQSPGIVTRLYDADASSKLYKYHVASTNKPITFLPLLDEQGNIIPQAQLRVRMFDFKNKRYDCDVTFINTSISFTITCDEEIDIDPTIVEDVWIYGQEVTDFHCMKKDAIWTISTAAMQEVDRQQQQDAILIGQLEATLSSLKNVLAMQTAQLNEICQRL